MKQHTGFKRDCLIQVCSWCANDCSSLTFQFRNIMLHPQFPFAYYCFSKPAHHTYLHENYYSAEIMIKSASTLLRREYFKHCKINHKALEPASSCVTFVSNCIFFFYVDHLLHPLTWLDIKMINLSVGGSKYWETADFSLLCTILLTECGHVPISRTNIFQI